MKTGKSVTLLGLVCTLILSPIYSHADYLVKQPPCVHVIHKSVYLTKHHARHVRHRKCTCPPQKHKRHCRHHRSNCCYGCPPPVCAWCYIPEHEPVTFLWGVPAPCGHYVNVEDCDFYDPDRITGDDDPTIYPGMDIDN